MARPSPRAVASLDAAYAEAAQEAYRKLNGSSLQERMRRDAPCWVGAVHWNPQEESAESLRDVMKQIRDTGFTFVRFHAIDPVEDANGNYDFRYPDMRFEAAEAAGLLIVPHTRPTQPHQATLRRHGISAQEARDLGPMDERVREAIDARLAAFMGRYRTHPLLLGWPTQGEPGASALPLETELDRQRFAQWLQQTYDSPAEVHRAWTIYPNVRKDTFIEHGKPMMVIDTWDDAVTIAATIRQGGGLALATTALKHEVYGAQRDLVRFRADQMNQRAQTVIEMMRAHDPDHPILIGNHQLFYNSPQLGWDTMASGRLADMHFSSIHLSWHFEHVEGEVDRPVIMQSRFTADAFKGGASSAYETTGGPVQYSGGYGNHMDAGLMRRLMLSYLGTGNEVIAFWDWEWRPGGLEAGEYGLISLSGKVTEWAREAGRVGKGMERYRKEIWQSSGEPEVAIVRSWNAEMILSLEPRRWSEEEGLSAFSRGPAHQHMKALIGAGRAAINDQVSYEYVTEQELLEGIAGVYPAVYLPHLRACSDQLLEALLAYVEAGGRLIADVQFAFHDQWGKVRRRGRDALLTKLFGAWVDSIHDARTCPQSVDGLPAEGFYGDIELAGAKVVRRFADGRPAMTEARIGRGLALLLAFDPARHCWKPGNAGMEALLSDAYRGDTPRRWYCILPMTLRRSAAEADHYYIINEGSECNALLRVFDRNYVTYEDVMTGEEHAVDGTISVPVPARSGVWLRCAKA